MDVHTYIQEISLLCMMIKAILDGPNPFKNNHPGKYWLKGFFSRNPKLTLRKTQTLSVSLAISCTPAVLDKWFEGFKAFLEHGILNCPSAAYIVIKVYGTVQEKYLYLLAASL